MASIYYWRGYLNDFYAKVMEFVRQKPHPEVLSLLEQVKNRMTTGEYFLYPNAMTVFEEVLGDRYYVNITWNDKIFVTTVYMRCVHSLDIVYYATYDAYTSKLIIHSGKNKIKKQFAELVLLYNLGTFIPKRV